MAMGIEEALKKNGRGVSLDKPTALSMWRYAMRPIFSIGTGSGARAFAPLPPESPGAVPKYVAIWRRWI
jgi:hypothetical protein